MPRKKRVWSVRGEGGQIMDIKEFIVNEVIDCDKKIKDWLSKFGVIKKSDIPHIHRPSLVRTRLKVLEYLGYVDVDNGVYMKNDRTDMMPIGKLPINSDKIDLLVLAPFRKLLISIVYKYSPRNLEDISEILREVYNINVHLSTLGYAIYHLRKLGFIKSLGYGLGYIADYDIIVFDEEIEQYKKWLKERQEGIRKRKGMKGMGDKPCKS